MYKGADPMPLTEAQITGMADQLSTEELQQVHAVVERILQARVEPTHADFEQLEARVVQTMKDGVWTTLRQAIGGLSWGALVRVMGHREEVTRAIVTELIQEGRVLIRNDVIFAQDRPQPPLTEEVWEALRNRPLTFIQLVDRLVYSVERVQSALRQLVQESRVVEEAGMFLAVETQFPEEPVSTGLVLRASDQWRQELVDAHRDDPSWVDRERVRRTDWVARQTGPTVDPSPEINHVELSERERLDHEMDAERYVHTQVSLQNGVLNPQDAAVRAAHAYAAFLGGRDGPALDMGSAVQRLIRRGVLRFGPDNRLRTDLVQGPPPSEIQWEVLIRSRGDHELWVLAQVGNWSLTWDQLMSRIPNQFNDQAVRWMTHHLIEQGAILREGDVLSLAPVPTLPAAQEEPVVEPLSALDQLLAEDEHAD